MSPPLLAAAVADVIVEYGWSSAYYVFDSNEGDEILCRLELLGHSAHQINDASLKINSVAKFNCTESVAIEFGERHNIRQLSDQKLKVWSQKVDLTSQN